MRVLYSYAPVRFRMEKPMQISLSQKYKILPTLLVLGAIALAASVLSILALGELMIPIAAAALSAIIVLERGRAPVFSIVLPALIIALDVFCRGAMSYLSLEITVLALILALGFIRTPKSECAFWMTATSVIFTVVSLALSAFAETGTLSLDSFVNFYVGIYEEIEDSFVKAFPEMSAAFGISSELADASTASALLRAMASMIPSVAIILAFAISGVTIKLQTLILGIVCDDEGKGKLAGWRFALAPVVYYAFWIVLVLHFLVDVLGTVGAYAIAVTNIYNVLLYVFAYVGLGIVVSMLTMLFKRRSLAILATVLALVIFSGLAIELIAYFGASAVFFGRRRAGRDK